MRSVSFQRSFQTGKTVLRFRASFSTHRMKLKPPVQYTSPQEEPLQYRYPTGLYRNDRLESIQDCEMILTTVGTASAVPGLHRGTSAHTLSYQGDVFLFDCGEGTQVQFQKMSMKYQRVRKIFITHCHGDHCFGLPGVLCGIGQATAQLNDLEEKPVDIYGPEGTRAYVRAVLALTQSKVATPHRIHELKNVPYFHYREHNSLKVNRDIKMDFNPIFGERMGGRDYFPERNYVYNLTDDNDELIVKAAPLQHTVPSLGYVIEERTRPGKLNAELVTPLLKSQKKELLQMFPEFQRRGSVMPLMNRFKNLKPNETFVFPGGETFTGSQLVGPDIKGRKVVVLGDTCNSGWMAPLAEDCDLLLHEATNSFIFDDDYPKYRNYFDLEKETISHGHSTPQMAGRFAAQVRAKRLVLTHFSTRYIGNEDPVSMEVMWRIENMARFGANGSLNGSNDVIAAWDFMHLPIPRRFVEGEESENVTTGNSSNDINIAEEI